MVQKSEQLKRKVLKSELLMVHLKVQPMVDLKPSSLRGRWIFVN